MKTEKRIGNTKYRGKIIVYLSVFMLFISSIAYIYTPAKWELIPAGLGLAGLVIAVIILREKVLEILRLRSTVYGTNTAAIIIIVTAIISMVNFIAYRHPARIDLTESGAFSLSEQTKSVLKNLKQEVRVITFVPDTPGARNSLEDLLKGYRYKSKMFSYEFIDPNLNPDMAERYNITSENTLIVMSGENQTKITETTENALTNAIIKVTRTGKKKIYFTEGHGERDIEDNQHVSGFYVAAQALRDLNYEVYKINLSTRGEVPADASVLIVADPEKPLLSNEIEVLEKYLNAGGRVVVLIDQKLKEKTVDVGLIKFLNKYGIYPGDDVVIERELQLFAGPTLGIDPLIKNFTRHPVTEPLRGAVMLSLARTIDFKSTDGVEGIVLAKTSEGSWAETNLTLIRSQRRAAEDSADRKGPVPVAVAVKKTDIQDKEESKEKQKEMRMVVIGDADFANNKLFNTLFNGDFFLNAVNWLGEEMDLVSIAKKDKKSSRIIISSQQRRWLLSTLFAIPAIFIIAGFVVWRRRRAL